VVGGNRVGAEQVWQKLFIRNVLDLRHNDSARVFIKLVAAPCRVLLMQLVDLIVVFAQEQRVERRKGKIFRDAQIARGEHPIVYRQIVFVRRFHMPVGQAQARRRRGARAVHNGAVEPACGEVERGGRLPCAGSGRRIDDRTGHGNDRIVPEHQIAVRHDNVDVMDAVALRQRQIMIDELAPSIHESRQALRVRHVRVALADDKIADGARIRSLKQVGNAVREVRGTDAFNGRTGGVDVGMRGRVAGPVYRPVRDVWLIAARVASMDAPFQRLKLANEIGGKRIVAVAIAITPAARVGVLTQFESAVREVSGTKRLNCRASGVDVGNQGRIPGTVTRPGRDVRPIADLIVKPVHAARRRLKAVQEVDDQIVVIALAARILRQTLAELTHARPKATRWVNVAENLGPKLQLRPNSNTLPQLRPNCN
jgi:hypothetical protein